MTVGLLNFAQSTAVAAWGPLRIGGGGFIRDLDIAPDGTMVCKTDTYGAYVWNPSAPSPGNAGGNGVWQQLCCPSVIPAGDQAYTLTNITNFGGNLGVWAIAIAPNSTSTIYMVWLGNLYKSTNRGVSFVNLTGTSPLFPAQTPANSSPNVNGAGPNSGPKMAVDPNNANVCWVGCGQSLIYTQNGGTSFTTVSTSSIPQPTDASYGYAIVYDPTSPTSGGITQNFYVNSYGNGWYYTSNGGSTFTPLTGGSFTGTMPTTCRRAIVDQFGVLWTTDNSGANANLHMFTVKTGTAFTQNAWVASTVTINQTIHSIAPDPASTTSAGQRVLIFDAGGSMNQTTNGGTSWQGVSIASGSGGPSGGSPAGAGYLIANDIPWLATNETSLTNGNTRFNPAGSNQLVFAEGIGVWLANPPSTRVGNWAFTSQTVGIEQLVSVHIVVPPGGSGVGVVSWDRDWFWQTNPKQYPVSYGTDPSAPPVAAGWGADYASAGPSYVALNTGQTGSAPSGFSNSYGAIGTWSAFTTQPTTGGLNEGAQAVAASSSSNIILISDSGVVQATTNGGSSWTNVTPSGTTTSDWFSAWESCLLLAADRVTANTFYGYGLSTGKIYVTSNTGTAWTPVSPAFSFGGGFLPQIKAVPSNAGHLFICGGLSGSVAPDNSSHFYRSINGGSTWTDVSNGSYTIRDVWVFGIGAPNGGSYPTIFIWGWVNGVNGVWQSTDNCTTWQKIGDTYFGGQTFDYPVTMSGDMNNPGFCYIGLSGSGYVRYGS